MKNMFLSRKEKKKEEAAPQCGGISRALGKVSFEGFDWWLFTLMLIILAIGLIMVCRPAASWPSRSTVTNTTFSSAS